MLNAIPYCCEPSKQANKSMRSAIYCYPSAHSLSLACVVCAALTKCNMQKEIDATIYHIRNSDLDRNMKIHRRRAAFVAAAAAHSSEAQAF